MNTSANISTTDFVSLASKDLNLSASKAKKLQNLLDGMLMFQNTQNWNIVELSRTLLGLGLSVREAATALGVDSGDITSNNNPRKKLGDSKTWVLKTLRKSPKYTKKFTKEQIEVLKVEYPNIKAFEKKLVLQETD